VVLAKLVPPVIVSPDVNVPEGTVRVTVVALGFVMTAAVTALVAPVIVSPRDKLAEDPTVAVMVPAGYDEIPAATVWLTWLIVHRLRPRLAQSANKKFMDRRAVTASYPVRNSRPQRSKASST